MKSVICGARLSVLYVALFGTFSAFGQTPSQRTLSEVVVTASRFAESANTLTYSASVITAEDIRNVGATSVSDAIAKLLGIPTRMDTAGGGNFLMDLRGFGESADRNQVVVVDGRRLRNDDLSATNMADVAIETVDRIEVVRGSGTVQYGEGATGGVIVITTKAGRGLERKSAVSTALSIGSFGAREVSTSAVLATGGISIDVAAKDAKNDGFRNNFASTANGLSGTAQWSNEWLRVGVLTGRQIVQSGWPGALSYSEYSNDSTRATTPNDFGYFKAENSGVFAEAFVGAWQLAVDANERTRQTRSVSFGTSANLIKATDLNLRARHESEVSAIKNVLVIGYDTSSWNNQVVESTYKVIGSIAEAKSSAFYITDDIAFSATGTRMSVGIRSDSVKKSESSSGLSLNESPTAWQLGVSQELTKDLVAFGHVGTGYRLATAEEYTYAPTGVVLQTQTSRDSELGLRWLKDSGKVELRWYQSLVTNSIGFDNAGLYRNVNFDPAQLQGIELEAKHNLTPSITGRLNAAYREARFTVGPYSGNDFPKVPHQTVAVGMTWSGAGGHSIDGGINWVSNQTTDSSNQCLTPAYATADARYAYKLSNLELAVAVKNIADTRYYSAFGCNGVQNTYIYPEPGRAVTASARIAF